MIFWVIDRGDERKRAARHRTTGMSVAAAAGDALASVARQDGELRCRAHDFPPIILFRGIKAEAFWQANGRVVASQSVRAI